MRWALVYFSAPLEWVASTKTMQRRSMVIADDGVVFGVRFPFQVARLGPGYVPTEHACDV